MVYREKIGRSMKNRPKESVDLVVKLAELAYEQMVEPAQRTNMNRLTLGYKPWSQYHSKPWTDSEEAIAEVKRMLKEEPERFLDV